MPRVALLVIDMLNDFFRQRPELAAQRQQLVASTNALIGGLRQYVHPVMWIRQEFRADLSDSFLDMRKHGIRVTIAGTDGCEILPDLDRLTTDTIIVKKRYSAFFGTNLEENLAALQPAILAVCGINTHACVRATVIDAYQRDYEIVVAADGIGSYDSAHHEMTARYLDGGIARVPSNADILRLLANG
jgi:maleamate amidohydrolase